MALPTDSDRVALDISIATPATEDRCSREFDRLKDEIMFTNLPPDDIKPNAAALDLPTYDDADLDAVSGFEWNRGPSEEDLSLCSWDAGPDFAYWPLHLSFLVNQPVRQKAFEPMVYAASGPAAAALDRQDSEPSQETARQETSDVGILLQQSQDDSKPVYLSVLDATGEPFWLLCDRFCDSPAPSLSYSPSSTPRASSPEHRPDTTQQAAGMAHSRLNLGRQSSSAKEWTCKICNKLFSDRKSLSQHSRYHTKRYACPNCNGRFGTKKDRRRHQETHGHGEAAKLQACEEEGCKFRFKACRKDIYRRHCKLIHKKSV